MAARDASTRAVPIGIPALTGGSAVDLLDPETPPGVASLPAPSDATIMMVDDEETTLDVIGLLLEASGYTRFIPTHDSSRAMELLEKQRPDLLLLDLMMPEVSGFDILAALRADARLAHIPVIILTSSTDATSRLKALDLGATDFLAKLVDPSELVIRVRNNLAIKAYQDRIQLEQERSERLLLNVLPVPVAERLKLGETTIADYFAEVTVLFADLVSFTAFSARVDAATLVERLNQVFLAFDDLVEARGLEKIKTSGDAYILAGGLPLPRLDHAEAVVETGLEMRAALARLNKSWGDEDFVLRIGVNTGPVVAGVIGKTKFNYDLWGDAVNVASRMESQGAPGRVQVSASTREALTDRFIVEARRPIEVKGKGRMQTYFVEGLRGAEAASA